MLQQFLQSRRSRGNYNLVSLKGGRFYVLPGDKEEFYAAFEHDMKNWDENNYECLTYRPCVLPEDNPLYIDIDLRYKDERPINLEQYKKFSSDVARLMDEDVEFAVVCKDRGIMKKNGFALGFHLYFPTVFINHED